MAEVHKRILLIHQNFPGQFRRIGHTWAQQPGWGETLYARDIFPNTRLIHFCEVPRVSRRPVGLSQTVAA
ncbi:hypothetical protein JY96_05735 [Aquabacterium sp. NJ1]|uniref:hypothetical protein n=1 Tax=Aquabacterium sp. NJ1 TaxID=1538295 RepID=UPI00052E107F|nr:hypothetical protein [Aquabacterium sp. NJ1]KGM39694.1 hypothetical protein JY96_05735 [Aquabacterium sp. NJ1]